VVCAWDTLLCASQLVESLGDVVSILAALRLVEKEDSGCGEALDVLAPPFADVMPREGVAPEGLRGVMALFRPANLEELC
jgi:hypothetical protein